MSTLIYNDGTQKNQVIQDDLVGALQQFVDDNDIYVDVSDLIFSNLKEGLFSTVLELYPPKALQDIQDSIQTQIDTLATQKNTIIGITDDEVISQVQNNAQNI